jgi:type IV secretory pathway protease TraF
MMNYPIKTSNYLQLAILLLLASLAFISCNSNIQMIMPNTSMEGTIKEGAELEIIPTEDILPNQVVAFKYVDTYYGEQTAVLRVVGIPGDTLKVSQGQLFVNGELFEVPEEVKYQYQVIIDGKLSKKVIKDMEYQQINSNEYVFFLTPTEAEILRANPVVMTLRILVRDWGIARPELFGADTVNKWNLDNYGPIKVPVIGEYGATENLYFVMGDNRHNAVDSRFIGYIPESDILGIVKYK